MCAPPGRSDPSGAAEADRHAAVFEDHRNLAASGNPDHPLELRLVGFDVDVPDRVLALRVVLTGRGRVGSGVLSENLDAFFARRRRHRSPSAAAIMPDAMIFPKESWVSAAPPYSWPSSSRRPPPPARSRAK